MNFVELRKRKGFSQEYVADLLGITRLTYRSREEGKTELKNSEYKKLRELYSFAYTEKADILIRDNSEISVYQLEYILECLEDLGLLSDDGIMIRSNIWNRFIKDSKIFEKRYIDIKPTVGLSEK